MMTKRWGVHTLVHDRYNGHNPTVHGKVQGGFGNFGGTLCGSVARGRGLHGDVGRLALHCVAVGLVLRGSKTYVA